MREISSNFNQPTTDDTFEPHTQRDLPDPGLTPGHCLTHEPKEILQKGYARAMRRMSEALKKRVFARYRVLWCQRWRYDLDHLVPLSLGGSNEIENLWPHPHDSAHPPRLKMRLERLLRKRVERGQMALRCAQNMLMLNWIQSFYHFCGAPPMGNEMPQAAGRKN